MREILESVALDKLSTVIAAVRKLDTLQSSHLPSVSIQLLGNISLRGIDPFLKYHLYASGIKPMLTFGGFDTIRQDLFSLEGSDDKEGTDLTVLALDLESFDPRSRLPNWSERDTWEELLGLFEFAARKVQGLIVVNTFPLPCSKEAGFSSSVLTDDATAKTRDLNQKIITFVKKHDSQFQLVDWEYFARILGEEKSFDYRYNYLYHAPFANPFLNLFGLELTKLARAIKGRTKKCLVLDCDNTLWGGVVGEDGIDGIHLDPNDYPGKAYYDFQISLLHLFDRGIMIALCSKNNEAEVMDVLECHPHCLISKTHLVGKKINWLDKVTNLTELADDLNLSLEHLVFVDDNPFECEMVRTLLPDVTVLQVPEHLYEFPNLLYQQGLFDSISVSEEDRERTRMYHLEAKRENLYEASAGLSQYFESLEMVAEIGPATEGQISRIAQLTQKTNQFNFTTHRYLETDIKGFLNSPIHAVFTLSAHDRFGSLGLVGVIIAKNEARSIRVDTFLMSCRALGRGLEYIFLKKVIGDLQKSWDTCGLLKAQFVPTKKNIHLENFWPSLGLARRGQSEDIVDYSCDLSEIQIEDVDFIKTVLT